MKLSDALLRHGLGPLVIFGMVSIAHANPIPLAIGAPIPMANVAMKNAVDGKDVSLAKQAGKHGTLVVFTCNHCPWAKKWASRIVELGNAYQAKGIGVVLINSNDPKVNPSDSLESTAEEAKQRGMKFPYVIDDTSAVAKAFGATKTPEAFLFEKSGKLVYHGTIDDNAEDPSKVTKSFLKDALAAVTSGKVPVVQKTKSLGCGIKFR